MMGDVCVVYLPVRAEMPYSAKTESTILQNACISSTRLGWFSPERIEGEKVERADRKREDRERDGRDVREVWTQSKV
jgi:hypothetical protein